MNSGKKDSGFTLVELLVTLGIMAILASLTAPSWATFLADRKINLQVWALRKNLELARGLALSQQQIWKVCLADSSQVCLKEEAERLLIFRDANNDHRVNTDEVLYRDVELQDTPIKLSASGRAYIRFKGTGEAMDSGNFLVCAKNEAMIYGRQTIVFRSGRIRLSRDTDGDGHDDRGGINIRCHSG